MRLSGSSMIPGIPETGWRHLWALELFLGLAMVLDPQPAPETACLARESLLSRWTDGSPSMRVEPLVHGSG